MSRAALGGLFLVAGALIAPASAVDVVEIEEHWRLEVGGPTEERSAPQVTMTMSPTGDTEGDFFVVSFNHWSHPDFAPGGVQVQRWCGDDCVTNAGSTSTQTLHHDNETVSWTQRMSVADGVLTFEVVDGTSLSWGSFGASGALRLTSESEFTRLNDYKPAISIGESGISYAGNRVSSLVLEKLRWKTADGEWGEMVAPIDIDSDIDP